MIDCTSALYLGLRHASRSLPSWERLTTGLPAALDSPIEANRLAAAVAFLQGLQCGVPGVSTLHLYWDFFGTLDAKKSAIFIDSESYPVALWGAERAKSRGAPVIAFKHHDPASLHRALRQVRLSKRTPYILADGFCPGCGVAAPVPDYLECLRPYHGRLILDDTQALGIIGHLPDRTVPFGLGGGGTLRWNDVKEAGDIVTISSLAKGFGAPLAVLAGSADVVRRFEATSQTSVHCSPPSMAAIQAGINAMRINATVGDTLRRRLNDSIRYFRSLLSQFAMTTYHDRFPIQSLASVRGLAASLLHERLTRLGVRSVLHRLHRREPVRISFVITARHTRTEIEQVVERIERAMHHNAGTFNQQREMSFNTRTELKR